MYFKKLIGISALVLMAIISCKDAKDQKITKETQNLETYAKLKTDNPCLADATWFQVDPISGKRKTSAPKEGSTSVFGNNLTVSNCNFHQWSWQKFLWLTNDVSGRPLFMENLIQVNSHNKPVGNGDKKIILSSKDNAQATGDILKTNKSFNSKGTSYDVYYSIHADSTLFNTINKYITMDDISKYTYATFPVGSLEVKVAWVNADAIEDANSYFVTDAIVEGIPTEIALLGMHVVGVVYNHPEFVWATFEHNDLAPYYDWEGTTTEDQPVTSSTNKLLFKTGVTATVENITLGNDSSNVFAVNKYGVPRQAGNVFLETSQDGTESYNNIESINMDVKSKLKGVWNNYFYNGSLWLNTEGYSYPTEQAELLVRLAGNLKSATSKDSLKGSVALYNITMETYEQLGFQTKKIHEQSAAKLGNCFTCHSAAPTKKDSVSPLNISHLFLGAHDNKKGKTLKDSKDRTLRIIKEAIKNME